MIRTSHQSRQMFKEKLILKYILSVLVVIYLHFWVKPYKYCMGEEENDWYLSLLLYLKIILVGFNGAETKCGITHILGILLMNSYD